MSRKKKAARRKVKNVSFKGIGGLSIRGPFVKKGPFFFTRGGENASGRITLDQMRGVAKGMR